MIKVYPVKIEATDEIGELAFTLESFDEYTAKLDIKILIGDDNIEELFDAIRKGVQLLELEKPENSESSTLSCKKEEEYGQ